MFDGLSYKLVTNICKFHLAFLSAKAVPDHACMLVEWLLDKNFGSAGSYALCNVTTYERLSMGNMVPIITMRLLCRLLYTSPQCALDQLQLNLLFKYRADGSVAASTMSRALAIADTVDWCKYQLEEINIIVARVCCMPRGFISLHAWEQARPGFIALACLVTSSTAHIAFSRGIILAIRNLLTHVSTPIGDLFFASIPHDNFKRLHYKSVMLSNNDSSPRNGTNNRNSASSSFSCRCAVLALLLRNPSATIFLPATLHLAPLRLIHGASPRQSIHHSKQRSSLLTRIECHALRPPPELLGIVRYGMRVWGPKFPTHITRLASGAIRCSIEIVLL